MLATVLAIAGTLLGSIVAGLFQHLSADRAESAAAAQQLRRDRLEAMTALATAISAHRRTVWHLGKAELEGAATEKRQELLEESHSSRGAVARPLIALRILITDSAVRTAANTMLSATYAMEATHAGAGRLAQARQDAEVAHDRFVDIAAAYLTTA